MKSQTIIQLVLLATVVAVAGLVVSRERSLAKASSEKQVEVEEALQMLQEKMDTLASELKSSQERERALQSELATLREIMTSQSQLRSNQTENAITQARSKASHALTEAQKKEIQDLIVHAHTIPQDLWGHAGFQTPEDSFLSTVFAVKEGDVEGYLNALTREGQEKATKFFEGKSAEEIATLMQEMIAPLGAIRLDRVTMVSDSEAAFTIYSHETDDGEVRTRGAAILSFKKDGDEWKSDGLF